MSGLAVSKQFQQFVSFATDALRDGDLKAIAREGDASGTPGVTTIKPTTGDKVFAIRRSQENKTANNATRTTFMKAVAEMFGGEANIPDSVLDAMNMKDFNKGKPLTARRIIAVMAAVDKEDAKMRNASKWLQKALLNHPPGKLSKVQMQQVTGILAGYGNLLEKTDEKLRGCIIDKLIDIAADPELGPHADYLFAAIPWDIKELSNFTLNGVREKAPMHIFE